MPLESPLDCKEIKPVNPSYFIEFTTQLGPLVFCLKKKKKQVKGIKYSVARDRHLRVAEKKGKG